MGAIYADFAYIYDRLMHDVDYERWTGFIEDVFNRFGVKPELIVDLGCGTGSVCLELAKRGYDMIGVDSSVNMLDCARDKALKQRQSILYLNQDMSNFELYGTVDAVLCLMDSINYVTRVNDLKRLLKLVYNYLNPGGIFVFDINTEYKLSKVLGENMFYEISQDITYLWENSYNPKRKLCRFDLTFFVHEESGLYRKFEETHYERAVSVDEMQGYIRKSGLKLLDVYDNLSFFPPQENSERVFFVCKKE